MCDAPNPEQDVMPKRRRFDRSKTCIRCKSSPGQIVAQHSVYCSACLQHQTLTKFRRALDASLGLASVSQYDQPKPTRSALIPITAGIESPVLFNMLEADCFSRPTSPHKPLSKRQQIWVGYYLAYIELAAIDGTRKDRSEEVKTRLTAISSNVILLRLEDAFDPKWWDAVHGQIPDELFKLDGAFPWRDTTEAPVTRLRQFIQSLPTPSGVAYVISQLSRVLLLYTAKRLDCSHILFGDTMTSLSVSLITSIASGDGFHIASDREEQWGSVRIIRPLRDLMAKECAAYYYWNGLRSLCPPEMPRAESGIAKVTKDFIVGLDRDFPSTVNAIARTCAKVTPKQEAEGLCQLCERPTPSEANSWKAMSSATKATRSTQTLCYACRTALSSRGTRSSEKTSDKILAPTWAAERGIAEFFLDD
ncbi:hypothetical protein DL93DRAFT_2170015 [Clavulina sp. PMI_390]|nr:hypothetical protein DL93DRAFT_2170015 [Clavulina sp. PMI_390]